MDKTVECSVAECWSGVGCRWSMVIRVGARVQIAGYPMIIASVSDERHATIIARAHAWLHSSQCPRRPTVARRNDP